MKSILIFVLVFLFTISLAIANGAGNEIKKAVNGFSFEFGIEPKEPKADERAIMSLSIHNSSTKEPLNTGNLWIRISKGNEILFTSNDFRIKADGPMFFGYTFKESGVYAIDVSAKYDGKDVKTNFTVNVKGSGNFIFKSLIILVIAFALGYATAKFLNKYRK